MLPAEFPEVVKSAGKWGAKIRRKILGNTCGIS
jgi:hypothetical protein